MQVYFWSRYQTYVNKAAKPLGDLLADAGEIWDAYLMLRDHGHAQNAELLLRKHDKAAEFIAKLETEMQAEAERLREARKDASNELRSIELDYRDAVIKLADYAVGEKDYDRAEKVYQDSLELLPDDIDIREVLSSLRERRGDYKAAVATQMEIVDVKRRRRRAAAGDTSTPPTRLQPRLPDQSNRNTFGPGVIFSGGRYFGGYGYYARSRRFDVAPNYQKVLRIYSKRNNHEGVLDTLRTISQEDPAAFHNMSWQVLDTLRNQDLGKKKLPILRILKGVVKDDDWLTLEYGRACNDEGDLKEAKRTFENLLAKNLGGSNWYADQAEEELKKVLQKLGEANLGVAELRAKVEKDPENVRHRMRLARKLIDEHEYSTALAEAQIIVDKAPYMMKAKEMVVERPIIEQLVGLGYAYVHPNAHASLRERKNEVLFQPHFLEAVQKINGISEADARAVFQDMAGLDDNEEWVSRLRGNYSRKLGGEDRHRTVRLIDFDEPANNHFVVTNQLRVHGATNRVADIVVYVNGIPLVVIEAKSPLSPAQNTWNAIEQIEIYEAAIPRLFRSNLFNIATNDLHLRYGTTDAPRAYWFQWPDPWPRKAEDFDTPSEMGHWALLQPSRLLDLLAHFIVFETRDGKTVKKICRYQQFRAVQKMVDRVIEGEQQQGLIWHTQGSGKSLTMVFAALKLKFHRGIQAKRLANPNILVVTDRRDLDRQIAKTFEACGLPNPKRAGSIKELRELIQPGVHGLTVLSTIFKFAQSDAGLAQSSEHKRREALAALAVPDSGSWIVMVDECHRTQEKELGAFLRAVLPDAVRFGFTGTPVKRADLDTFRNFGIPGEPYLDKYGIDDAVRDGATVPIYYMGRKTEWHLHDKELDVVFDQWFANEPDEVVEELKARGITRGDLARFEPRIRIIATDIWAHYRAHVLPDGYKAQVVAIDRRAVVAYKKALDRVIAKSLEVQDDLFPEEARARAEEMSVCIYTAGQHDAVEHPELVTYHLDAEAEREAIANFLDPDHPLRFLIVCNKLLTGFDAPVEQVLYLDSPLTDHNLLQAIARTNRRYSDKQQGIIVDYIGVSRSLSSALSAYRSEDVEHAMRPEDDLLDDLKTSHRKLAEFLAGFERGDDLKADILAVIDDFIGSEDRWYEYRSLVNALMSAYAALSPDPRCLSYTDDVRFVGATLPYGKLRFEQEEERDWREYSEKIRAILREHLEVEGLTTTFKLRSLEDAGFWTDFDAEGEDLKTAAVRKMAELKKISAEKAAANPAQYEHFSDRVKEIIAQFEAGQMTIEELMAIQKEVAEGLRAEEQAHEDTGLTERAHAISRILDEFELVGADDVPDGGEDAAAAGDGSGERKTAEETGEPGYRSRCAGAAALTPVQSLASQIDALYASDESAPMYWQDKESVRKELRNAVLKLVYPLFQDQPQAWDRIPRARRRVRDQALRQALAGTVLDMPELRIGETTIPWTLRYSDRAVRKRIEVTPEACVRHL